MTGKFLFGGDKITIKAIAEEGYYPKSISVDGKSIATNDETDKTEIEAEIDIPNIWPRNNTLPEKDIEIVPVFELAKQNTTYSIDGVKSNKISINRYLMQNEVGAAYEFTSNRPYTDFTIKTDNDSVISKLDFTEYSRIAYLNIYGVTDPSTGDDKLPFTGEANIWFLADETSEYKALTDENSPRIKVSIF